MLKFPREAGPAPVKTRMSRKRMSLICSCTDCQRHFPERAAELTAQIKVIRRGLGKRNYL